MKKISKLFSGLFLASFMALGLATIGSNDSNHLVVRDVLAEDVSKDVTGKVVRRANGGEANGLISEVKAQVSQPKDDKISIRFIAGLDSYLYETAKFNINVEDANKSFEGVVTTAYTAVEVGNGVLTASEVFGEGYNYLIAYTINGVPSSVWNSSFEVTASIQENAESEFVVSEVSNKVINEMLKADNNTVMVFNAEDLKEIANNVNNGSNRYKGKTVKLMKDIDLANEEWTPIGNGTYSFQGNFEGNGRTISNLKVTDNPSGSNKGLFGFTTDGKISNLVVENAEVKGRLNVGVVAGTPYTSSYENITVKGLIKVDGMAYVGGVFGKNVYANLTNITVDAAEGSYVKADSYENGLAYRTYVGGVAGFMGEGTHEVKNVTSNIDVYGTVCDVGGLVGIAHEGNKFTNVTITGNVYLNGVDTDASSYLEVGGLAGVWMNNGRDVVFTNCSFKGEVEVTTTANIDLPNYLPYGGLLGKSYNETGDGKLIIDGVNLNDKTKVFIFSKGDLVNLSNEVANGNTFAGKTVLLMNDIDLENEEWTPIGNAKNKFQGNFDGQDYTISNLKITTGNDYVGLFGFTTDGHIANLTIHNADVKGRVGTGALSGCPYTTSYDNITLTGLVKVEGMSYVGGVLGRNAYANVSNITVNVEEGSYVKGNSVENGLAYRTYVGGVIGFMGEGTHEVKNVTSNIDVYGTVCDVGGLVGIAHEGNKFTNVTITGNVYLNGVDTDASSYLEVGGLAGVWINNGRDVVFTNCSFTGEVEVTTSVEVELPTRFYYDGLVGKPYNDTTSNKLYINGVDVTDLKPVAPEPKTLEVDHVECYGDWFMKVFLKYDGFTFEDINRSTIVVSMSNNSAPSTGEQVGYAGNFFIRIDANERGAENKTTGTSFVATVAFELNDGTPCSAEFKVHNGAVVDEFPTPEPEEPETPDTPVVPGETKTIEISRIECYGDWFMKVFFKYDDFAFADINASTIKVTMSNNSAATVGEKVGYAGEFMIRFDANERGNENKTVGTAYVATIEFELNDGTKYVAEFNVSKGAIVDELPTPEQPGEEPEVPDAPIELPAKPEGALDLVLGGNWNPHGDGFLVFGWTNAGLTNDIIAEYKVTAIIDGVESAFTFNRIDGAVHAFFRNTDLGTGIGGASYILVVEFTTTDGTVYFAAVNVVNGSRA